MKQLIAAVAMVIVIISLIVAAFTINQVNTEEGSLKTDLQYRSILLNESLKESVEPNFINKSESQLQRTVDKFDNQDRYVGVIVFDNKGVAVASS